MISDGTRGGTSRAFTAFAAIFAVSLVLGLALRALGDTVARDFRHDLVWYRYGAPPELRRQSDRWYPWSAPLLMRWAREGDPLRVAFAESAFARLGGWPARQWLDEHVARNPYLKNGADALFGEPTWRAAFGLDDAGRRTAIINAALRHPPSPMQLTFDDELLRQLNVKLPATPAPSASGPVTLRELMKTVKAADRMEAAILAGPPAMRRTLMLSEAAQATRDASAELQLAVIAGDAKIDRADALVAAAVLHSRGDHRFDGMLRAALNAGDLHPVNAINDYYVDLKLAEDFANTRYVRGMKAYDAIRGGHYFGDDRAAATTDEKAWRGWLAAYGDHPGADDATYWLIRSLEVQARRADALAVLTTALMSPVGDGDMYGQLWSRFLYLLDVGTKDADLDAWLGSHKGDPLEGLIAYARGVRYARVHAYGKAFDQTAAFAATLRAAAARMTALDQAVPFDTERVIAAVNAQAARWHHLGSWVIYTVGDLHPEHRELVIQEWAGPAGWTIPYLALYDGMRMGGGGPDIPTAMDPKDLAENYRHASALATALELTSANLADKIAGPWTRERDRYRAVALLYAQLMQYPDNETLAMHPLPFFPPSTGGDATLYTPPPDPNAPKPGDPYSADYARLQAVQTWYVREAVAATRALIAEFPQSAFADSALMCVYEMSGERKYLDELLQRYPDGDRAEEARAALYVATHRTLGH